MIFVQAPPAEAQAPTLLRVWSNDYFSSDILDPNLVNGSSFVIDILVENLPPIVSSTDGGANAFDIVIRFNPRVLAATEVDWRAPFCPLAEGCLFDSSSSFAVSQEVGSGIVRLAVLILGATVDGSGTLFRIRFEVLGTGGSLLDIDEFDSTIVGPVGGNAAAIPYKSIDGSFSNLTAEMQPPVAIFVHSPLNASVGQTVVFDASASFDPDFPNATNNGIVSYSWNFGDGNVVPGLTQPVTTHAYAVEGLYSVTLTVIDVDGLEGFATDTIFVALRPAHNLAIRFVNLEPAEVPLGEPVTAHVGIENEGEFTETSTLYAEVDRIPWASQVLVLPPRSFNIIDLRLETTALTTAGTHIVALRVDPVQGETQLGDNVAETFLIVRLPQGESVYTRIDLPNQFLTGGTPLNQRGDDITFQVTLPFAFPFYGSTFTSVWASTNGLVTPLGPDSTFFNSRDELVRRFAIAPLWDDWLTDVRPGDDVYTLLVDPAHFMIRWQVAPIYNPGVEVNFEVILGADGTIQFNYGPANGLISATLGISDGAGDSIIDEVAFVDRRGSILFAPFRPEHDLAVVLQTPSFVPSGGSASITAAALNQGTSDETNVALELQIDGLLVNSTTVPVLAANASSVSISYLWTPATLGDHTIRSSVSIVPGENFTANNEATAIVNVREPLIRPQTGQYAEYESTISYPGYTDTVEVRIEYGEYISPEFIAVTISVYNGFNQTNTLRVNVFTREVFDRFGFAGYWFGWIETNIGIGSTVNLGFPANVAAREPFVTPLGFVDAWRLESPFDASLRIWYDRGVGVLLGYNQSYGSFSQTFVLVATNIPLTILQVHRVALSPDHGPVGTQVAVSGSDAPVGHEFEIRWDGQLLGTVVADEQESFTFTFNAPPSPAGPHAVRVTDLTSGFPATATFTIVPSLSLEPAAGPVGTRVLVRGTGMPAQAFILVNFDSVTLTTATSDATGSFEVSLLVPFAEPGEHLIQAQVFFIPEPRPGPPGFQVAASAVFTIIDQTALSLVADTGAVYFPSDAADVFIQVSFHGSPVDPSGLTVKLWKPDGSSSELTTTRLGTGLYKATISVPRTTGTYLFEVQATYQTHSADAKGSTIDVFEVKPAWLSERSRTMITVTGSILATMAAAGVVLYRTRKKAEDSATRPF